MALDKVSLGMIDNTGAVAGHCLKMGESGLTWGTVDYAEVSSANPWADGPAFTRVSDSSFTVTDNADNQAIFVPGRPIRYKGSGSYVYGIVTAYSTGTVTLAGAPMTTSYDDTIQYGDKFRAQQIALVVPGACLDVASNTLMSTFNRTVLKWLGATSYVVSLAVYAQDGDTGDDQPRVNAYVDGQYVFTDNSSAGIEIVNDTWAQSAATADISYYQINYGDTYDLSTDGAGSNGDGGNITVILVIVTE